MKKLISMMLALVLMSSAFALSAMASEKEFIFDEADVLSSEEEKELEDSLGMFSRNWDIDTKVVLLSKARGTDISFDAENLFNELCPTDSGLLLAVDCANEEAALYAGGIAGHIMGDYGADDISSEVSGLLGQKEYKDVIYSFIASAGAEISYENYGEDCIPSKRLLPRVVDSAALLDISEQKELTKLFDDVSEKHDFDVVLATVNYLDERNARDFADDWYDYNGYGMKGDDSGILFLISMGERDWAISTHKYGLTAFTDAGQELIIDRLLDDLSNGYYMDAFSSFAESCDEFLTAAENGEPIDVDNIPKGPMSVFSYVVALAAALLSGFMGTFGLKNQLTTVEKQEKADSYTRKNSIKIPDRNERFLYSNVSRSAKPKPSKSSSGGSSSHSSSSGRSHGGSSGKF